MKKKLLTTPLWIAMAAAALAQSYTTAAGLRMGTDWGLSIQQRILKRATVECILQSSLQREELMLTVLAEHHQPILSRRLNLYGGAGLHKGFLSSSAADWEAPFGISLIGGAEFTIARLALSWDFKPAINLWGGQRNFYAQTGISVRYVVVKSNVWQKRQRQKKRARRRKALQQQDTAPLWQIWRRRKPE